MSQGTWALLVALVLATGVGAWRALRDGRFRGTRSLAAPEMPPEPGSALTELGHDLAGLGHDLGDRATLLQFSSAFCAPCRATRRVLGEVAHLVPGVTHVEVDAEQHLELVRRLGVVRTPTTLVLDARGHEVSRASGAPHKGEVLGSLARALDG
jgi:thiol-disulfide isomerase/thioredoxin